MVWAQNLALAIDPIVSGQSLSVGKYQALEDFRGLHFLFVPGYLYDPFNDLSKDPAGKKWHVGEYFHDARGALKAAGVDERIAEINSEDSIFDNASDLAGLLGEMPGPVVIVSHSKGGLETLEMFLRFPELRKKVVLWISLQSPFYGSEIADVVYGNRYTREFAKKMLEDLFEGTIQSLEEMQTSTRESYMRSHASQIRELSTELPIISVGSWITPEGVQLKDGIPAMLPVQKIMALAGATTNDGLVEISKSYLPRSRFVRIAEMDHADAVMPFPNRKFDRVALLKMLLDLQRASLLKALKP
jgi:hypothetical protein